jgi:hypothetical protein
MYLLIIFLPVIGACAVGLLGRYLLYSWGSSLTVSYLSLVLFSLFVVGLLIYLGFLYFYIKKVIDHFLRFNKVSFFDFTLVLIFGLYIVFCVVLLLEYNLQVKVPNFLFSDFLINASQYSENFGSCYNSENLWYSSESSTSEKFNCKTFQSERAKDLVVKVEVLANSVTGNTLTYKDLPDLPFQRVYYYLRAPYTHFDSKAAKELIYQIKVELVHLNIPDGRPPYYYKIQSAGGTVAALIFENKDYFFFDDMSNDMVNMPKLIKEAYGHRPLDLNSLIVVYYSHVAISVLGFSNKQAFQLYLAVIEKHNLELSFVKSFLIQFFKAYHGI